MNARQRMLCTINFEKADRPFRWETPGIWGQTVARWAKEGLPAEAAASGVKLLEFLGYDRQEWAPPTVWAREPFYPLFEHKALGDDGRQLTVRDTDGITKKILKTNPELSMPQFLKFPVETSDDYFTEVEWRLNPDEEGRFPEGWESRKWELADRDYPLGMFIVGPFGHARNLMGEEKLMYAFYDDPGLIRLMMERWSDFYVRLLAKVSKTAVPDMVMVWEDMCYKNGPLISPGLFREFMLPGLKEIFGCARSLGVSGLWVDNDGDCLSMLPVYLEAGANGFYPFECSAKMDIAKIRAQYGKRFAIIGGIDKYMLSDDMAEEDMIGEIERKVIPMLEFGGYIPMLDHSAPPNISFGRFMRFLGHVRELPEKYRGK